MIIGGAALVVIAIAILYTRISIFVVQPIGSLPEGRTLVISRLNKMNFVDSADAMCARIQGGVNLLCRGMVLGTIVKNSTIYLRLPYSEWLYGISTDGKKYDR